MQSVGYAALEVIPSMKGFEGKLVGQTNPILDRAGASGGSRFGESAGKSMSSRFVSHAKTAALLAGGVLGGVAAVGIKFAKDSVQGYEDHLRVLNITRSTIKATGGAAHVTTRQVSNLSDALERQTGVDGDIIQAGANMLLTFKNVRDGQGKNNKIFDQSLSILTDMSTAMGTDAKSSAIQLGKALNDPVAGISALSRVGVTFDQQQKDQIANFVKQGQVANAQKIILRELTSEFGGAAKAQRTMGDRVLVGYHALQDEVGKALLPEVRKFERFLSQDGLPAAEHYFRVFKREGVPQIKEFLDKARPLAESVLPAAGTAFGDIAGFLKDSAPYAKKTIDAFNSLPSWAQKAVVLGAAGGYIGKKTGVLDVGMKMFKGGGASSPANILGAVKGTPADPMYVFVTNPDFGGGGGFKIPPIIPSSAEVEGWASRFAKVPGLVNAGVAAQIVKGVVGDVSIWKRALGTPTPSDPSALSKSRIGGGQGLKLTNGDTVNIDFDKLSRQLVVFGSHSKYLAKVRWELQHIQGDGNPMDPNSAVSRASGALHDLAEAEKLAGNGVKYFGDHIPATTTKVDAWRANVAKTSREMDLAGRRTGEWNNKLRGLPTKVQTEILTPGLLTTATDVEKLQRKYHLTPRQVSTLFKLTGIDEAKRQIREVQGMAGRHLSATYTIDLAGRGAALDGVRRRP